MTTPFDIRAIAGEIRRAQDEVRQVEPLTSRFPSFDVAAGYEVAHQVHADRLADGAVAVGRKIGFTNPDMWALYGVGEPVWAYVHDRTVSWIEAGARCSLAGFCEPKIEPEIVFHFDRSPAAGADLEQVLACIDWVAHGFEVVQSHFPGWRFKAADTVADAALHGALMIGPRQTVASLGPDLVAALASFSLTLWRNDEVREQGRGSNVLGSPLAAIAHLAAVLDRQPQYQPLQPGELVTTGTITSAQPVHAGETWRTTLSGIDLPGMSVAFTS
jgi:2-keto-4-pentenoate hydratase